jgi:hypothetical protein
MTKKDRRREGADLGNLGLAYSHLGEPRKVIELFKESLVIRKAIEDPRIIGFYEKKLKELEGFGGNQIPNQLVSNNPGVSNSLPASKSIFKSIFSKMESKT